MKDPKLIHFLRHLTARDLKGFREYIASPYFNQREGLKTLLEVLEDQFLKKKKSISMEELYQLLYGNRPFNQASLKTSMSQLLSLLQDFLAYSKFQEDKIAQHKFLLQKLNDLGESKYFPSLYNKAISTLEKQGLSTADFHYDVALMEEIYDSFRNRKPARDPNGLMQQAVQHLGYSFLIRMLRYKIRLVHRQATFSSSLEYRFMDLSLEYISRELSQLPQVVQAYFQFYQAITSPDQIEIYRKAVQMLSQTAHRFSIIEANEFYTSALNLAVQRVNQGQLEFLSEILSLYQDMLMHKIILEKGRLSPWHFKNIVNAALRLEKFQWAKEFIEEWQNKIFPDYAQNAFNYNQGMLTYYQKQYETAERYFNQVLLDYKDIFYGLNSRGFLLQIYFETENMIGLESLIHSFRMSLSRNQEISDQKRRMYMSFINHLKKLINIPPRNQDRLKNLYEEIKNKKEKGVGSAWLLEKIADLLGDPSLIPKLHSTQIRSAILED